MPAPRHRSRSKRRVMVRTPGGKTVVHYEKRHKSWYKCAVCGKGLFGVPREPHKYPKSQRRPERPYGGYLCHECLKRGLVLSVVAKYYPNLKDELKL